MKYSKQQEFNIQQFENENQGVDIDLLPTTVEDIYSIKTVQIFFPGTHPFLLDAVYSGIPNDFVMHKRPTFSVYYPVIGEDIEKIVRLCPESLLCTMGEFRCRDYLPPLAVACFNPVIPKGVIRILLKNGADPQTIYHRSNYGTTVVQDLKKNFPKRFKELEPIFLKFESKRNT